MHAFLLHNGQIHGTAEPLVSPGQTGFMNGWGVFSTLRVYDGVLFEFARHYNRMKRDAELMHVPFPFSAEQLEMHLLKLVDANHAFNATLRVSVTRNRGGLFEGAGIRSDVDLVAFTADLSAWAEGVKLYYVPNGRHAASPFAGTKVTSWCQNLTWNEEAHDRGFDEVVLLNEHGNVSECTSANIFAVFGNQVFTPPRATAGCLGGITRAVLLEEIRIPGLTIEEHEISPDQLETADQVFITSTTRNLIPVLELEGKRLTQSPSIFKQLSSAFEQYQVAYVAAHPVKVETTKA